MVFTAMETDYFPRQSAVNQDVKKRNIIINRQIEVSLLLLSPMLVAFMVSLPLLLPLLYSNKFIPVTDMIRITIKAMYFRTIKLPIAYLTLARGNSKAYLFLEATYDVIVIILTVVGFTAFGLVGAGYAITLTCIIDVCIILLITYYKIQICHLHTGYKILPYPVPHRHCRHAYNVHRQYRSILDYRNNSYLHKHFHFLKDTSRKDIIVEQANVKIQIL